MSLPYYYATLSASPPLTSVGTFAGGQGSCRDPSECTNLFSLSASPVGGSGSYDYQWEFVGEYPPERIILSDDKFATAQLSVTGNTSEPDNEIEVNLLCTVTDVLRPSDPPVDGTLQVISQHGIDFG